MQWAVEDVTLLPLHDSGAPVTSEPRPLTLQVQGTARDSLPTFVALPANWQFVATDHPKLLKGEVHG